MIGLAREVLATDHAASVERLMLGLGAAQATNAIGRRGIVTARALATAELANAYRLGGELSRAERTLVEAGRLVEGLQDADARAGIEGQRILLLCAQGKGDRMHQLIRDALRVADGLSDHALGRLYLVAAISLEPQTAPVQVCDHLENGLRLIDPRREPRLVGVGLQGLGYRLIRLGKPEDGRYFLRRALAVGRRLGTPVDRARCLWAASWADWVEGAHDAAIDKLEIASRRLASLGQPTVAGTAFLDLSRARSCRGQWNQAERAARTSREILGTCDVPYHLAITETVLREVGRTRLRSSDRVAEAVDALM